MRGLRLINSVLIVVELFLCGGGVVGFPIVFGHAQGDLYIFAGLYLCVIAHIILTFRLRRTEPRQFLALIILFSFTTIAFSLKATIWRGPAYPWSNKNVFFRPEKP